MTSKEKNVNVLRIDIMLNVNDLELEADMECGKLFDTVKVRPLVEKFIEDLYSCIDKEEQ